MEVNALQVGAGRTQALQLDHGFFAGHAELSRESRIAAVTLARHVHADPDAPLAAQGHRQQHRNLAGGIEMHPQTWNGVAMQP